MKNMSVNNASNIFLQFLELLKIKHTKLYSSRYYNEHLYKNTLFGISKMLWAYRINNVGLRLNDKKEIQSLGIPFIAQLNQEFVIVSKIAGNEIAYLSRNKEFAVTSEEFYNTWSGGVFIAEPDENSIEPDYKENRKKEFSGEIVKYLLLFAVVIGMILNYVTNKAFLDPGYCISLMINIVGCYTGYLLMLKQLHIQSDSADKLCSLLKKGDCNSVLESSAAKFMGIVGWSEIGLGYFLSNIWIIVFEPRFIPYLAFINICALPYSFWSIWYQKFKIKEWCVLCLVVQLLLWGIFFSDLLSGFIQIPRFTVADILGVWCIYLLPFLIVRWLLPVLVAGRKTESLNQEINSLRMHKDVFLSLLKQRSYCEVDKTVSKIVFGNPEADLRITILTNPHCDPCGRMHARVKKILESSNGNLCVQYIFSSFYPELESSAKKLIAIYMNADKGLMEKAYDEWFEREKFYRDDFFKKYEYDIECSDVVMEFEKHVVWKKKNSLHFTPMVFINGYEMPQGYRIEDMVYFLDLMVDNQ